MTPTVGRIVNYVLPNGAIRPAIVVRVWDDGRLQLQQFTDQTNDGEPLGIVWRTSVVEGCEPGQWHWPVREGGN